ncbi:Hypothetical protein UVM_LOCUS450 [uncultured virus]|nr:Hypothetical protein UVM_LOCUS450 [uncultured virus]
MNRDTSTPGIRIPTTTASTNANNEAERPFTVGSSERLAAGSSGGGLTDRLLEKVIDRAVGACVDLYRSPEMRLLGYVAEGCELVSQKLRGVQEARGRLQRDDVDRRRAAADEERRRTERQRQREQDRAHYKELVAFLRLAREIVADMARTLLATAAATGGGQAHRRALAAIERSRSLAAHQTPPPSQARPPLPKELTEEERAAMRTADVRAKEAAERRANVAKTYVAAAVAPVGADETASDETGATPAGVSVNVRRWWIDRNLPKDESGHPDLRFVGRIGKTHRLSDLLVGAQLPLFNLSGLDLSGLDLRGAILTGANLCSVNLTNAAVRGATFDWASLNDAIAVVQKAAPPLQARFSAAEPSAVAVANYVLVGAELIVHLSNAGASCLHVSCAPATAADAQRNIVWDPAYRETSLPSPRSFAGGKREPQYVDEDAGAFFPLDIDDDDDDEDDEEDDEHDEKETNDRRRRRDPPRREETTTQPPPPVGRILCAARMRPNYVGAAHPKDKQQ